MEGVHYEKFRVFSLGNKAVGT